MYVRRSTNGISLRSVQLSLNKRFRRQKAVPVEEFQTHVFENVRDAPTLYEEQGVRDRKAVFFPTPGD